jgi:hypothetical protein
MEAKDEFDEYDQIQAQCCHINKARKWWSSFGPNMPHQNHQV